MSKISDVESSRAIISDPWPVGTKAIVQCDSYLSIALKLIDGDWRDIYGQVLDVEKVVDPIVVLGISN